MLDGSVCPDLNLEPNTLEPTCSVIVEVAGGLLTPESIDEGAQRAFVGSTFICQAASFEAVKQRMEDDVYYKENVVG
jgi:hypothetical protein